MGHDPFVQIELLPYPVISTKHNSNNVYLKIYVYVDQTDTYTGNKELLVGVDIKVS